MLMTWVAAAMFPVASSACASRSARRQVTQSREP